MKKLFTLLTLLVAIVTGAQADSEWELGAWSTGGTTTSGVYTKDGLSYYGSPSTGSVGSSGQTFSDGKSYAKGDIFLNSGGKSTFQNNKTYSRVFAIEVSQGDAIKVYFTGSGTGNRSMYLSYNASSTALDTSTAFASSTSDGYTGNILTGTASTAGTVYLWCDNGVRVYAINVKSGATEAFTVTFDAGSNGTCATTSLTETAPGAGVTLPEVTANTGYGFTGWYTDVTDETTNVGDAGEKYNPTANITLTAGYAALAAPTISVEANATTVAKNDNVTLTATVDGNPKPTLKWYRNTSASTEGGTPIEGETATTYAPSTANTGIYYFYAVATNSLGSATSTVQTITVTGSNKCKLSAVNYSNGFKAFIKQPSTYKETDQDVIDGNHQAGDPINGTVEAYYMEGTTAPTIASVDVSEGASYAVSGNTLTVTAEDGTTTAVFDITLAAVAPYTGTGTHTFDGNETWVKTGNNFDSSKGWKIARSYESDSENKLMISQGSNRAYLFLGPNASVTITQGGTARSMQAYKNGVAEGSATTGDITVTGDATAPYMVEITQTSSGGGDGAIKSINITPSTVSVKVTDAKYATFVPSAAVTFEDVKGYAAVYNSTKGSAELVEVTAVPAGTPVVVYAAEAGIYHLNIASEATAPASNDLKVSDGTVAGDMETIYGLKKGNKGVGFYPVTKDAAIAAGKVYLQIPASEGAREFIGFGGEEVVTGIDAIENGTIDNDAPAYNLAGQKVGKGYKGIVIINGKKVVK